MEKFCKFCGKEMVNGTCDCAGYQAQNGAAPVQSDMQANQQYQQPNMQMNQQYQQPNMQMNQQYQQQNIQMNQQYQQPNMQMNQQYQQPNMQMNQMYQQPSQFSYQIDTAKNLFIKALKKPITAAAEVKVGNDLKSPLYLLGVQLVILFLSMLLLRVPDILSTLDSGLKVKIGFSLAIYMLIDYAIYAAMTYAFSKKYDPMLTYSRVLAVFCVITVPGTVLYLVAYVCSLLNMTLAIPVLGVMSVIWTILSILVINMFVNDSNSDTKFWNIFFTVISVKVIMVIIKTIVFTTLAKSVVSQMANGAMSFLEGLF